MLPATALALLFIAVMLAVWARRIRRSTGLPWAPVLFGDTSGPRNEEPLLSRRLGLVGKPDYLLAVRGRTVPVEVKPGRTAQQPYASDLMQLAAYCVLVEEVEGVAPPYGLLRYADRTFRLEYTPEVRQEVVDLMQDMRDDLDAPDCPRSHQQPARCHACGFFSQCDDALEG